MEENEDGAHDSAGEQETVGTPTSANMRNIAEYSQKQLRDLQQRVLARSSVSALKLFVTDFHFIF